MLKKEYLPVMVPATMLIMCIEAMIMYIVPTGSLHDRSVCLIILHMFTLLAAPVLVWVATGHLLIFIEKTIQQAVRPPSES